MVSKVATSGGSGGGWNPHGAALRTPQWDLAHCSEASPGPISADLSPPMGFAPIRNPSWLTMANHPSLTNHLVLFKIHLNNLTYGHICSQTNRLCKIGNWCVHTVIAHESGFSKNASNMMKLHKLKIHVSSVETSCAMAIYRLINDD